MFQIGDRVIYEDTEVTIVDSFNNGGMFAIELDEHAPDRPDWVGALRDGVHGRPVFKFRGRWVGADQLQPLAIKPVKKGNFIYVQYRERMPAVVIDNLHLASLEEAIERRDIYRRGNNPNTKIEVYLKLD